MANVLATWKLNYEPTKDTFKIRFLARRIQRKRKSARI